MWGGEGRKGEGAWTGQDGRREGGTLDRIFVMVIKGWKKEIHTGRRRNEKGLERMEKGWRRNG